MGEEGCERIGLLLFGLEMPNGSRLSSIASEDCFGGALSSEIQIFVSRTFSGSPKIQLVLVFDLYISFTSVMPGSSSHHPFQE